MDTAAWTVLATGVLAIAATLWLFFGPRRATAAHAAGSGPQEFVVEVDGGYRPDTLRVAAQRPIRLVFRRLDSGSCTDEVRLPSLSIAARLPSGRDTVIEIAPQPPGEIAFVCGMGMLRGRIVVVPPAH